jgi:hypothetical protein
MDQELEKVAALPMVRMQVPEGVPDGPKGIHHSGKDYAVVDGYIEAEPWLAAAFVARGFKLVSESK